MVIEQALELLAAIFGPFDHAAGVSMGSVVEAEARLGVTLPHALRELYRRTGAAPFQTAHNALRPLEDVGRLGEHLVFYDENQGVVAWGVSLSRLAEADPPVDQGQRAATDDGWTFFPEHRSVSEFACAQGAWQAVQGALPYVGALLDVRPARAASIAGLLGHPDLETATLRAWLVNGGVAVVAGDDYVGLGTHTAEAFCEASLRLEIDVESWDYATVQSE